MTRRLASAIVALALGLGGVLVLLGMAQQAGAEEIVADMSGNEFVPGELTITVGDTVTWTNSDTVPHTVTSDDGGPLDSGIIDAGATWSYTFTEPGTYSFYCEVHPSMQGTVTVVPAGTTTTMPTGHEMPTTTAPPTTDTTAPTTPTTPPPGGVAACSGAVAALEPFLVHFAGAHLQTSPGQQVAEALDVDQYALTHMILIQNMLEPLLGALDPFLVHFDAAHLQTSPGQQVAEALDVDEYALTHTVLVENMLGGTC
jgi:plastocyanin